jgi:hypothetical protein
LLLAGDVALGLVLTTAALLTWRFRAPRRRRQQDELGQLVTVILDSFGLAVLLVEGVLPGAWLIGSYGVHGGQIENNLLPGSSIDGLLRAMVLGLAVSTVVGLRRYWRLLFPPRKP